MNNIESRYFEWLCSKILDDHSNIKYEKLMSHLYDFVFIPVMDMDNNRAEDGKELRYRFGREENIPSRVIRDELDNEDRCSMLELMIALSIRCEESIMTDDNYGDRTGTWFWNMIVSLDLGTMNDIRYDEKYVNIILNRLNNRTYKRNGEGGLFTIPNIKRDLRTVEIWYQMCWYLDSI